MLKITLVILGVLGLVNPSFAQTIGYGVAGKEIKPLVCSLAKAIAPSASMQKVTQGKVATYGCAYEGKTYELSLVGVKIDLAAAANAGSKLNFSLRCTAGDPTGIYIFGGYPTGFQTSTFDNSPWFYNPNPKVPGGRCYVVGDSVISKSLSAVKNKSALVVLPLDVNASILQ